MFTGPNKIIIRGQKENIDDKSYQWFGATVHSSGENGAIVVSTGFFISFLFIGERIKLFIRFCAFDKYSF